MLAPINQYFCLFVYRPAEKLHSAPLNFVIPPVFQWAVCHREAMQREKHRSGICCQVHQEASEHGKLSRSAAGGDRAGGGHPAADSAPQHCHAARRLREPH